MTRTIIAAIALGAMVIATASTTARADSVSVQTTDDPACYPNCTPTVDPYPDNGASDPVADAMRRAQEIQERTQKIIDQNNQNFEQLQDDVRRMLEEQNNVDLPDDEPEYEPEPEPAIQPAAIAPPSAATTKPDSTIEAAAAKGDPATYLVTAGRFHYPEDELYRAFDQYVTIQGRILTIQHSGGMRKTDSEDHTHRWTVNIDAANLDQVSIWHSTLNGITGVYELDFYFPLSAGTIQDPYYDQGDGTARARILFNTESEAHTYLATLRALKAGATAKSKTPDQQPPQQQFSGEGDIVTWVEDMFGNKSGSKVIKFWNRSKKKTYKINQVLVYDCENVFLAQCGVVLTGFFMVPDSRSIQLVTKGIAPPEAPFSFKYSVTYEDANPKAKPVALNSAGSSDSGPLEFGMPAQAPATQATQQPAQKPAQKPAQALIAPQPTIQQTALPNGDRYEGMSAGGVPSGPGKLTAADGSVTEANFVNGLANGHGTWRNAKGESFFGTFVNGDFSAGTYNWPDGQSYIGAFSGRTMNGQGTLTAANGATMSGPWKGGEPNGLIKFKEPDGFTYSVRLIGREPMLRAIGKINEVFTNYGYVTMTASGFSPGTVLFAQSSTGEILLLKVEKTSGGKLSATPRGTMIAQFHPGQTIYVSQ